MRVLEALQHIRLTSPYWERNNGQDHFMVSLPPQGAMDCIAQQEGHAMLASVYFGQAQAHQRPRVTGTTTPVHHCPSTY